LSDDLGRPAPGIGVIPGAGSAGHVWQEALKQLPATLLVAPDAADVTEMAEELHEPVEALGKPRVLVGASLGAMVALELSRTVRVDALVLVAAGFGITVSDSLLAWVTAAPDDLFPKMAKASIAERDNPSLITMITEDFAARGQPVVLRHLQALSSYRPRRIPSPPRTLVLWGEHDHSVPLADHVELAMQCNGALVPIRRAGHMPFLEQPDETVRWIHLAARLAQL
jgi:pimeloyl-ACP methyl ester carboxylesterase